MGIRYENEERVRYENSGCLYCNDGSGEYGDHSRLCSISTLEVNVLRSLAHSGEHLVLKGNDIHWCQVNDQGNEVDYRICNSHLRLKVGSARLMFPLSMFSASFTKALSEARDSKRLAVAVSITLCDGLPYR